MQTNDSLSNQMHLAASEIKKRKTQNIIEQQKAEQRRIKQQRKFDKKLTEISRFLISIENEINKLLRKNNLGNYELHTFSKDVIRPLGQSNGLKLKKYKKTIAQMEIIAYFDFEYCDYVEKDCSAHIRKLGPRLRKKIGSYFIKFLKNNG